MPTSNYDVITHAEVDRDSGNKSMHARIHIAFSTGGGTGRAICHAPIFQLPETA